MRCHVAVLLMLVVSLSAPGQPPEWVRYQAKSGAFAVSFPKPPIEQITPAARGGAPALHVVGVPQRDKNDPTYVIMYRELPAEDSQHNDAKAYLSERQNGIVAGAKGKLLAEKEIRLQGQPGREFLFQSGNAGLVRCRLYLVRGTLYHLSYFSMSNERQAVASADPFFGSFTLMK